MAIDAHSTTVPADHRPLEYDSVSLLPPSLIGAVPVPTPALTAETVAMLAEVFAEIGENPELPAAEVFSDPGNNPEDAPHGGAGMARHGGAGEVCSTVEQTAVADLASALHMRRALEGALDHGTALLAALGLPRLMEPGFVPLDPAAIGDALDTAIATLDALDAAGMDLEPSLGWIDGKPSLSDSHDDREAEDDDEPMLGAPERHPAWDPWSSGRNSTGRQTHWSDGRNGSANDGEAEAGYDLAEGDDERCGSDIVEEGWLGVPENHAEHPDQEHWGQGQPSDAELDPLDDVRHFVDWEKTVANRKAVGEMRRNAEAIRRKHGRVAQVSRHNPGNLTVLFTIDDMGVTSGGGGPWLSPSSTASAPRACSSN